MKKVLKFSKQAGIILILIILTFNFMRYVVVLPMPTVLQEVESPDGKYVAYIFSCFEYDDYRLTIRPKGIPLMKSVGNTYVNNVLFKIKWVDENHIYVDNYATVNIFKQENKVWGVSVNYNYLTKNHLLPF